MPLALSVFLAHWIKSFVWLLGASSLMTHSNIARQRRITDTVRSPFCWGRIVHQFLRLKTDFYCTPSGVCWGHATCHLGSSFCGRNSTSNFIELSNLFGLVLAFGLFPYTHVWPTIFPVAEHWQMWSFKLAEVRMKWRVRPDAPL